MAPRILRFVPEARFAVVAFAAYLSACGGRGLSADPLRQPTSDGGKNHAAPTYSAGQGGSGDAASDDSLDAGAGGKSSPQPGPDGATGTRGCTRGSECASSVCLEDVTGAPRCCEADCRAMGRVCSTAGLCVCSAENQEVGGECLLRDGEACRDAARCANEHCVDGVCCEASCDRDCERCDARATLGRCVLDAEDRGCSVDRPGFQCVAQGRCRLPKGQSCGVAADCDSEHCEPASKGQQICCERACHGTCELCGVNGSCDAFPASDDGCPLVSCPAATACRAYRTPEARECRENGACAGCEPSDAPAGVPCGVGAACDGNGSCLTTNLGVVAAGGRHTCAVSANGNVRCWGRNVEGELGTAFATSYVGDDEAPADLDLELDFTEDVVAISAGYAHSCVLFLGGGVRCWGMGDPAAFDVGTATLLGLEPSAVHTNSFGFVDPLTTENVRLPGPAVAISAAAGGGHTCALLASGDVVCWGFNGDGQCGSGDNAEHALATGETLPSIELGGARVVEVRAADDHTCVLLEGGDVSCWGEGNHGRLGYGDDTDRYAPDGTVAIGEPVLSLAVGSTFTCVLLARGRVRCFGADDDGQLGYGHSLAIGDDETPATAATLPGPAGRTLLGGDVPVGGGEGVVQLVPIAGSHAVCARFASGSVRCWGENDHGELGYGYAQTLGTIYTPDELAARFEGGDVELGGSALALAEGGRCALVETAETPALYCWGDDRDGQLGIPQYFPDGSKTLKPFALGAVSLEP